jgi:hypothetical protein
VASLLVLGAPGFAAGARSANLARGSDIAALRSKAGNSGVQHRRAEVRLAPTCHTVPTSLVARDLGTSVVMHGPGSSEGPLNSMGKNVLIGGKIVDVEWWTCTYDHNPSNPSGMGVAVSYLDEATAARALTIVKAMCSTMRSVSPAYVAYSIGAKACLQGHTGPMQSANGLLAVGNVVVALFGSQSPAQTLVLLRGIAALVAKAKVPLQKPVIRIRSSQFAVANGALAFQLTCSMAKCSGDVTFTETSTAGPVVVAESPYVLAPVPTPTMFDAVLTSAGSSFFASAPSGSVQLTLTVTVSGGTAVSTPVNVTTGAVTTTTTVTTTTQ